MSGLTSNGTFVKKTIPLTGFRELAVNRLLPNSPNILPLLNFEINNRQIILELPFAFKRQPIVTEEDWIKNLREIVSGLSVLESVGLFHCDLRPANILFSQSAHVLIDFGTTRPMKSYRYSRKIHNRLTYIHNLSPEMLSDQSFDQATDLWALGVTMLEWRQKSPFRAMDYDSLLQEQLTLFGKGKTICEPQWPEASAILSSFLKIEPEKRMTLESLRYILSLPPVERSLISAEKIREKLKKQKVEDDLIEVVLTELIEAPRILPTMTRRLQQSLEKLILETQGELFST